VSGVAVLIPAYNEADRVGETIKAALGIPGVSRVVVIDDGSMDGTFDAARASGADPVIRLPRNRGKGAALNAGLRQTTEPVLLLLDADLNDSSAEGIRLVTPILSGGADMTIATFRRTVAGGGFGFAVKLARWGIRALTGRGMTAPLSGQRCVVRTLLEECGGFEQGFGVETALTIDALRRGYRVLEVETGMTHRVTGRDWRANIHRARQFRDIGLTLLKRALSRGRNH